MKLWKRKVLYVRYTRILRLTKNVTFLLPYSEWLKEQTNELMNDLHFNPKWWLTFQPFCSFQVWHSYVCPSYGQIGPAYFLYLITSCFLPFSPPKHLHSPNSRNRAPAGRGCQRIPELSRDCSEQVASSTLLSDSGTIRRLWLAVGQGQRASLCTQQFGSELHQTEVSPFKSHLNLR